MPSKRSEKRDKADYGSGSVFEENGSWHVKFYPAGSKRQKQKSLGRVSKLSEKEARKKATQVMAGYKAPDPESEMPTFEAVGKMHIAKLEEDRKPATTEDYKGILKNHLNPLWGTRPVDTIKPGDVEDLLSKLSVKGLSVSTRLTVMSLASGVFKFAQRKHYREVNPCSVVERPKLDRDEEIRPLTVEEFEAVLRAVADDELGQVEKILYLIAGLAGLRRGELISLRWRDVDFTARKIRIFKNRVRRRNGTPKSGHGRWVPMTDELARFLDAWSRVSEFTDDDDLVLTLTGAPLSESTVSKRWKKALLKAEVGPVEMKIYKVRGKEIERPFPTLRLHELRHTFASHAVATGAIALRELQHWMGHASSSTTERYAHFMPADDAADRLGQASLKSLSNPSQNPRQATEMVAEEETPRA